MHAQYHHTKHGNAFALLWTTIMQTTTLQVLSYSPEQNSVDMPDQTLIEATGYHKRIIGYHKRIIAQLAGLAAYSTSCYHV
jgi:hypothetical protein